MAKEAIEFLVQSRIILAEFHTNDAYHYLTLIFIIPLFIIVYSIIIIKMYKLSKIIKFHLFTPIYQLKHIKSGVDCATNALLSISGRNDLRNKYTHINRCMPSIARNYYGLCKYFSTQKLTK